MLELRDVETAYGRSQVLFRVSLEVRRSEVVSLLGRNGMGKTTTVKSIMGICLPKAGAIAFNGRTLHGLPSYRIAQAGLARGAVLARRTHVSAHPNRGSRLEIVTAEDADRIEGLQFESLYFAGECIIEIESHHHRRVVGWLQPDDFRMTFVGLGQNVPVRLHDVRHIHPFAICVFTGTKNVAVEKDRLVCVRQNRRNSDRVIVCDLKPIQRAAYGLGVFGGRKVEPQHCPVIVRFQALNLDLSQSSRGKYSTGQCQHFGKILLSIQFVNGRAPHHSFERNQRPQRRNQQSVARLQPFQRSSDSVKQQIVDINFVNQLLAPIMLQGAKRSVRRRPTRYIQSIERRGKRAYIVSSGAIHIAHHINADRPQPRN